MSFNILLRGKTTLQKYEHVRLIGFLMCNVNSRQPLRFRFVQRYSGVVVSKTRTVLT